MYFSHTPNGLNKSGEQCKSLLHDSYFTHLYFSHTPNGLNKSGEQCKSLLHGDPIEEEECTSLKKGHCVINLPCSTCDKFENQNVSGVATVDPENISSKTVLAEQFNVHLNSFSQTDTMDMSTKQKVCNIPKSDTHFHNGSHDSTKSNNKAENQIKSHRDSDLTVPVHMETASELSKKRRLPTKRV